MTSVLIQNSVSFISGCQIDKFWDCREGIKPKKFSSLYILEAACLTHLSSQIKKYNIIKKSPRVLI